MELQKKITMVVIMVLISTMVSAQILADGQRKGLIQATATIYPSQQLNTKGLNIYLGGYANYYFHDKYSFRGDCYQYINSQTKPSYVKNETRITWGFMRYFPVKRFDPYVGVQMGISLLNTQERPTEMVVNSTFSVKAGLNFHVYKFFYFFLEMDYTHQPDPWHARPFDQFMGSGGLGFQIPIKNIRQE